MSSNHDRLVPLHGNCHVHSFTLKRSQTDSKEDGETERGGQRGREGEEERKREEEKNIPR